MKSAQTRQTRHSLKRAYTPHPEREQREKEYRIKDFKRVGKTTPDTQQLRVRSVVLLSADPTPLDSTNENLSTAVEKQRGMSRQNQNQNSLRLYVRV
ncbi:Nn.00g070900.m01.CDS01 [Neocucurbitaria sp. VM-36]